MPKQRGGNFLLLVWFINSFFTQANAFVIDQWVARPAPYAKSSSTAFYQAQDRLNAYFSLAGSPLNKCHLDTDPLRLKKVAQDTLSYIEKHQHSHGHVLRPLPFTRDFMSLKKVKETLQFIVDVITEDEKKRNTFRISDPGFINKHFGFIKWDGDSRKAKQYGVKLSNDSIYLTKYTVYKFEGSYTRTNEYQYALYGLRNERKIPPCTKQEIIAGVLEKHMRFKNMVKPLVWLTRSGLEEALMQGTIFVTMPDKKLRAFNVQKNNGFTYERKKGALEQKRYWFFREINHACTQSLYQRYNRRKEVVFAGNIQTIGVGKVVAISYTNVCTKEREIKLGILADTGSAFKNNLYQLDFFVGINDSRKALYQRNRKYPELVDAYILYKKNHHA